MDFTIWGTTSQTTSRPNRPELYASYRKSPAWIAPKPNPTNVLLPSMLMLDYLRSGIVTFHSMFPRLSLDE